jgi:hypothetical protein
METYQDLELPKDDASYLYDWVFHHNAYAKSWAAIPRDVYTEYWDKHDHPNVLRSSKLETLLEILHKSKGDPDVIHNMIIKA